MLRMMRTFLGKIFAEFGNVEMSKSGIAKCTFYSPY